jgi:hypothetical protein
LPLLQFDQLNTKYEDLKLDMVKVQVMLQTSEAEKRQLEVKMETQERFWVQKVKGLEESYRGLMDKL